MAVLSKCDPDLRIILSGDPDLLGVCDEAFPEILCPTVQNVTYTDNYAILWPDRVWGDTEPWNEVEKIDPGPGPSPLVDWTELEIPKENKDGEEKEVKEAGEGGEAGGGGEVPEVRD